MRVEWVDYAPSLVTKKRDVFISDKTQYHQNPTNALGGSNIVTRLHVIFG